MGMMTPFNPMELCEHVDTGFRTRDLAHGAYEYLEQRTVMSSLTCRRHWVLMGTEDR